MLVFPRLDVDLIALGGFLDGLLLTILDAAKQAATMGWMIADPKHLFDQLSHPRRGPDLSPKAEGFGSFGQQCRQLRPLLGTQLGCGTRRWLMAQGFHSLRLGLFEPLAHRALCHAQCGSDIFLFPSLFMQFPGAYPSSFAPIFGRCRFLAHTSFHRYVSSFSLASSVAINRRAEYARK